MSHHPNRVRPSLPRLTASIGVATALIGAAAGLTALPTQAQESGQVEALVRGRVEALRAGGPVGAGGERLLARAALPLFYESRGFTPAWIDGALGARLDELEASIQRAGDHGLDPQDYHLEPIRRLRASLAGPSPTTRDRVDLELLASDAFLILGSHLLHGRVNPETVEAEWLANRRNAALHEVLARAVGSGEIARSLVDMAPRQRRYERMLEASIRLRQIAREGGWPSVPDGRKLELGVEGAEVSALRARLRASGDLGQSSRSAVFDEPLAAGVRAFQARHGLDADGVVGPATLRALNVPAAERARQLEVNMERWRWLPADLGERHIEVNIAGFDVKVVESGRTVRQHRAIVGREYRQTPMFSGVMSYLVLAPYWHVPPTIAAVDKLPLIRRDPGVVAAQGMTLLDQASGRPVPVGSVDWASLTGGEFNRRYRLRQDPGPSNALGSVKFMFPNRHSVYLHDTPSRELFARTSRGFSSGCIRVEHPLDLAEYLLGDQREWTRQRIDAVVAGGVEKSLNLTQGVPVHLLYWTAWADPDGTLHFRDDIYGRDETVLRGLRAEPPGA